MLMPFDARTANPFLKPGGDIGIVIINTGLLLKMKVG
jgi:hypothetical protein